MAALAAFNRLDLQRALSEVRAMRQTYNTSWSALFGALKEQYAIPVKRLLGQGFTWTLESLVKPELLREYPTELPADRVRHGSVLDRKLRTDFFQKILPTWLQLEDRMSMALSIESRLPFLDYRLVEFAFGLADHLKIHRATTKFTLRKAMAGALPASIVADQKKQRFSGPGAFWLKNPLREVVQDLFLIDSPMIAEYVNEKSLAREVEKFMNGSDDQISSQRMWTLFSTEMWMRQSFRGSRIRNLDQDVFRHG